MHPIPNHHHHHLKCKCTINSFELLLVYKSSSSPIPPPPPFPPTALLLPLEYKAKNIQVNIVNKPREHAVANWMIWEIHSLIIEWHPLAWLGSIVGFLSPSAPLWELLQSDGIAIQLWRPYLGTSLTTPRSSISFTLSLLRIWNNSKSPRLLHLTPTSGFCDKWSLRMLLCQAGSEQFVLFFFHPLCMSSSFTSSSCCLVWLGLPMTTWLLLLTTYNNTV